MHLKMLTVVETFWTYTRISALCFLHHLDYFHAYIKTKKCFVYFCLFTSFFIMNSTCMHFNIKKKQPHKWHYHVEQSLSFPMVYDTVTLLLKFVVKKSFPTIPNFFGAVCGKTQPGLLSMQRDNSALAGLIL